MNDRELLEWAANAADLLGFLVDAGINIGSNEKPIIWNPLKDDGDALRLAVRLTLEVDITRSGVAVRTSSGHKVLINDKPDPYAATRRAIVRAAAEIAKMDGK